MNFRDELRADSEKVRNDFIKHDLPLYIGEVKKRLKIFALKGDLECPINLSLLNSSSLNYWQVKEIVTYFTENEKISVAKSQSSDSFFIFSW